MRGSLSGFRHIIANDWTRIVFTDLPAITSHIYAIQRDFLIVLKYQRKPAISRALRRCDHTPAILIFHQVDGPDHAILKFASLRLPEDQPSFALRIAERINVGPIAEFHGDV